jgi:hypothetical protein
MSAIAFGHTACTSHPACGCRQGPRDAGHNNEALAFSAIDIEVAGFVIWEATSGQISIELAAPHSRQACEPGCASQTRLEFP